MPREIIVVEGKDDAAAVKKACQAEVIITNGLGITKKTLQQIKVAQERCGVIIFTDPDYPGEKIRQIIDNEVPGCRHAYLYQQEKGK
ncbi:MAG: ribonuclease M5, partial [Firmicutes bacterium HGW-Firmicutes-12]